MNQNPNPNVMGQPVNPDTYNEHYPNLQPSTPEIPNPANEPAVFGPFGSTEWIDQLTNAFKSGQLSSISGANGQIQLQGNQSGALQGQLNAALQALFQRDDITCIRRTQDGLFEVDTKNGAVFQGQSLRGVLQQIPNLDLAQPFSLQGQRPPAQASQGMQGAQGGQGSQGSQGSQGTSPMRQQQSAQGNAQGGAQGGAQVTGQGQPPQPQP